MGLRGETKNSPLFFSLPVICLILPSFPQSKSLMCNNSFDWERQQASSLAKGVFATLILLFVCLFFWRKGGWVIVYILDNAPQRCAEQVCTSIPGRLVPSQAPWPDQEHQSLWIGANSKFMANWCEPNSLAQSRRLSATCDIILECERALVWADSTAFHTKVSPHIPTSVLPSL